MKISPDSVAGKRLLGFGVTDSELAKARLLHWNAQLGGAITVALPFGRVVILMKSRYLPVGSDGQLIDGPHLPLVRHEFCHVAQIQRWGFFRYWAMQLWARVQTRSVLARESAVERPCYEAEAEAAAEYDD